MAAEQAKLDQANADKEAERAAKAAAKEAKKHKNKHGNATADDESKPTASESADEASGGGGGGGADKDGTRLPPIIIGKASQQQQPQQVDGDGDTDTANGGSVGSGFETTDETADPVADERPDTSRVWIKVQYGALVYALHCAACVERSKQATQHFEVVVVVGGGVPFV